MIITFLRSSSYGTESLCQQQFFLRYVLGYPDMANQKAVKGSMTHKALEGLALVNLAIKKGKDSINDGEVYHDLNLSLCTPEILTDLAYDFYCKSYPNFKWCEADRKDCHKWVNKVLDYSEGMLDPRFLNILNCEQHFDFSIEKDWAKYNYNFRGQVIDGYLGLKGTIDLITFNRENSDIIEVIDYKTGKRLNWATGKEKTYEDLQHDPQLLIYFYALRRIFPQYKQIMMTLVYINDGGPHSVVFDDNNIEEAELLIKKKFEKIRDNKQPELINDWKCNRLCPFGSRGKRINGTTICNHIKNEVEVYGIDLVTDKYTQDGFNISGYGEGGGQKNR